MCERVHAAAAATRIVSAKPLSLAPSDKEKKKQQNERVPVQHPSNKKTSSK
jgi:hypothetical protein